MGRRLDARVLHHKPTVLVHAIDLDPYLDGPAFAAIRQDPAVFAAVTVDSDAGTITWPNGADLAPDVLYDGRRSARMETEARAS